MSFPSLQSYIDDNSNSIYVVKIINFTLSVKVKLKEKNENKERKKELSKNDVSDGFS